MAMIPSGTKKLVQPDGVEPMVGQTDVFVSHCWGGRWGDLVAAAAGQPSRSDRSRRVWIDVFAVRQWPGNGADLNFKGVIERSKSFLLVMPPMPELEILDGKECLRSREAAMATLPASSMRRSPFFRVWCLVEIQAARLALADDSSSLGAIAVRAGRRTPGTPCSRLENVRSILTGGGNRRTLRFEQKDFNAGIMFLLVDVNYACATVDGDKERILGAIRTQQGGVCGLNRSVRQQLASFHSIKALECTIGDAPSLVQAAAMGDAGALYQCLHPDSLPSMLGERVFACAALGYANILRQILALSPVRHGFNGRVDIPVDVANDLHQTSIMVAAQAGHTDCVLALLDAGADVNACERKTSTLFKGSVWINGEFRPLLEEEKSKKTPLSYAAFTGALETIVELLNRGAKVDGCFDRLDCASSVVSKRVLQDSPLAVAAERGEREACELLLKRGACDEVREAALFEARNSACASSDTELLRLLSSSTRSSGEKGAAASALPNSVHPPLSPHAAARNY